MGQDVSFNWIKDIPQWGTFVGTFAVSFLAMFSGRLKNWISRPKLKFSIDNERRFCELVEEEVDDRSDRSVAEREFTWCLKIENVGRQVAEGCRVQCDRVYQAQDSGDAYTLKREFIAQPFYWQTGELKEDVVPGRPSWCRIFILSPFLSQKKETGRKDETRSQVAGLHLYLGVEQHSKGRYLSLRNKVKNAFLVPLSIHFHNSAKSETVWVYAYWTDGDKCPTPDNFSIKILEDSKVKSIVKGL